MIKLTIVTAFLFVGFSPLNAQKLYKEIPAKKISSEKVKLSKNFINNFLEKCADKDYTNFTDYNLSNHFKKFIDENLEQVCTNNEKVYGVIKTENLNSVYNDRYSNLYNPVELYIYNVSTEKNKEVKFISIWMTQNENLIDGIWISNYKPLEKAKDK